MASPLFQEPLYLKIGLSSIVPCCLILAILYLTVPSGIFVIREIVFGDRSPLFQKCRMVERFVFLVVRFCFRVIFSQAKIIYDKS